VARDRTISDYRPVQIVGEQVIEACAVATNPTFKESSTNFLFCAASM